MSAETIRTAWRLFRSDSGAETVAALVIVAIIAGPSLVSYYRSSRQKGLEK